MRAKRRMASFLLAGTLLFTGIAMPVTAKAAPLPAKQEAAQPAKPKAEKPVKPEVSKPAKPGTQKPAKPETEKPAGPGAEKPVKIGPKDFRVDFKVTDEYENKLEAEVTVTNTGKNVIRDWAFSCKFTHKILNIWNARILKTEDDFCVIGNYDWNQNIAPGETVSFGLIAEKAETGEIVFPTDYKMVMKEKKVKAVEFGVDFIIYSDWGEGNNGALIIKNLTDRTIHNWKLSFKYDREIVSISNALIVSYKNGKYTLRNADYNADIEPHGTVHISFNAGSGNGKEKAEHFKLDETVFELNVGPLPKPEHKPGEHPEVGPGHKPGEGPATKPEHKPGEHPEVKPGHKPGEGPAVKPGHKPGECPTVKPEEPTVKPEEPEVFLNVLSGTVTDAVSAEAVTGSALKVLKDGEVVATAFTDEEGTYSFELYDGNYTLLVEKEHYYAQEISLVSEANGTAPAVLLKPVVYTLTGVVTDKVEGKKLSEVIVTVRDENGSVAETVTDENGAYTVELYHKAYELEFEGTDYAKKTVTVVGGEVPAVDVELERSRLYETGYLYDYQTLERVEGVTVTVKVGDEVISTDVTDEEGNYKVTFSPGEYTIIYEKAGYEVRTTERSQNRDLFAPGVPLHPEVYKVYGYVNNALNGEAVSGAAITVYAGTFGTLTEIPEEEPAVATGCSGEDGSFDFMLPKGEYTLVFVKEDYIPSLLNAESVKQETEKVVALSPFLRDNEFRIVLTWGSTPKDLDSYLKIYEDDVLKTQLFHARKVITEDGEVVATLDMDDKDGNGPETVTVTVLTRPNRKYSYSVKCYSSIPEGGVTFAQSGATVTVYCGEQLVKIYTVPETQEEKIWDVFDIVEGQIIDR